MRLSKIALCGAFMLLVCGVVSAQTSYSGQRKNYISTAMPILTVAPDAIAGAMGDAGVATRPDAFSAHWNNAKFAFIDDAYGFSTTYTPWLRRLGVSDMNLLYLSGYYHINPRSAVALSLTYFSMGELANTDALGNNQGSFNPNEYAIDLTYSMKVSEHLSIGASGRFNRSDLTNGQDVSDGSGYTSTKAANCLAADLGIYYQETGDNGNELAFGAFISNLGAKASYSDDDTRREFLPCNLRFGGRYSFNFDEYNQLNLALDFNKLLVPTPPVTVAGDSVGSRYYTSMNEYHKTSVMKGAIQSFFDAPGGLKEEFQEMQVSFGAEYWYAQTFAFRAGYFWEHKNKGGRQYFTVGCGLRYQVFDFDFSYLVPTTSFSTNPLSNTIRISLAINFEGDKGGKK